MTRQKKPALVIAFDTTAQALAAEKLFTESGLPGRMIPIPSQITAGCGLAWKAEPEPEPEPAPEPATPADRQAVIDAANAYAVTQYGVVTDASLTLSNSAYRFPAAVPVDASQETLEVKARDMVDFTFRQLMMQAERDSVADAGFRCNVCIVEDGGSLLIYVLYDG